MRKLGMLGLRILLSALFLVFAFPSISETDSLPESIGPLRLRETLSGEEARQEVHRLHGKAIPFQRGYIGTYGDGKAEAKLWVSEYGSEGEAVQAVQKMAGGLKTSTEGPFWHFQELSIDEVPVYFVVGMGQAHYFFQRGIKVAWLAVDPSMAKQAIRDLIAKSP